MPIPEEIQLQGEGLRPRELMELLSEIAPEITGPCRFELRHPKRRRRSVVDASVLVAIVAGTSAGLSALISGLFRVLERRQNPEGKIVLRGADGRTVEVPSGISDQRLREVIELSKSLDHPKITLTL